MKKVAKAKGPYAVEGVAFQRAMVAARMSIGLTAITHARTEAKIVEMMHGVIKPDELILAALQLQAKHGGGR
jgi:hypothetical protein